MAERPNRRAFLEQAGLTAVAGAILHSSEVNAQIALPVPHETEGHRVLVENLEILYGFKKGA